MALNIKDEAVHRDARRLAALTGKTITTVVREAVAARLEEVEAAEVPVGRRAEAILAAAHGVRASLVGARHSADHADLYGDDGLPT